MTPTLFLLATLLHLAPALWPAIYTGLDTPWTAAFGGSERSDVQP